MNFNDRFCLSHPQIHTLSLGAEKQEHVDIHLASIAAEIKDDAAPESWFARIKSRVDQAAEAFRQQGREYCTLCQKCLPCPESINIPEVLRFRNMWKAYDMRQFVRYRYKYDKSGRTLVFRPFCRCLHGMWRLPCPVVRRNFPSPSSSAKFIYSSMTPNAGNTINGSEI